MAAFAELRAKNPKASLAEAMSLAAARRDARHSAPGGKGVTARINVVQKLRDAEGGGGRGQAMKLLKAKAKPVVKAADTSSGDDEVDRELDRLLA